jgi:hypothetical protein
MLSRLYSPQRPLYQVPKSVVFLLAVALMTQIYAHTRLPENRARAEMLPPAPGSEMLKVASFGDPVALSKYLNLWLQIFDNQPGISIPFKDLDYTRVRGWLQASLDLDPRGSYPLLAAARLYGEIPYPEKQRLMLDFVYEKFLEAPDRRWSWLAHATLVARHRMQDLPLALKYAQALADKATGSQVPHWAGQMAVSVLEDMGELQAAEVLIGGLLDGGQINDPHELRFLYERLERLREAGGPARN